MENRKYEQLVRSLVDATISEACETRIKYSTNCKDARCGRCYHCAVDKLYRIAGQALSEECKPRQQVAQERDEELERREMWVLTSVENYLQKTSDKYDHLKARFLAEAAANPVDAIRWSENLLEVAPIVQYAREIREAVRRGEVPMGVLLRHVSDLNRSQRWTNAANSSSMLENAVGLAKYRATNSHLDRLEGLLRAAQQEA